MTSWCLLLPSKGKKRVTTKDEYCSYAFLPLDGRLADLILGGDNVDSVVRHVSLSG